MQQIFRELASHETYALRYISLQQLAGDVLYSEFAGIDCINDAASWPCANECFSRCIDHLWSWFRGYRHTLIDTLLHIQDRPYECFFGFHLSRQCSRKGTAKRPWSEAKYARLRLQRSLCDILCDR